MAGAIKMNERYWGEPHSLFSLSFAVWFIAEILFNTTLGDVLPVNLDRISSMMDCIVFLLLLIQIVFFQVYSHRELLSILLVTLPIAASTILSGSVRVMGTWMFIVAFKYTDLDGIIAMAYRILRMMIPAIVFLCLIGLLPDAFNYRFGVLRHAMGFNHPNYFGMKIFQFSACYVYLHWHSLKKGDGVRAVLVLAFLYFIPHSVTSILCTAVLFLLTIAGRFLQAKKRALLQVFETALMLSAVLCIAGTVLLTIYGMNFPLGQALDAWMSYRFSHAKQIYAVYKISLFGQSISSGYLLDSGYMDLILRSGLLVYLLFFVGYIGNMSYHKNNPALYLLLCTFGFYGIMEYGVYLIARNLFLLSFADILYSRRKKQKENIFAGKIGGAGTKEKRE